MRSGPELGGHFRSRPLPQPGDLKGVVERAIDEVCALFSADEALLLWEESEEPWIVIGRKTPEKFTCREEKVEPFTPVVSLDLRDRTFWMGSPEGSPLLAVGEQYCGDGDAINRAVLRELPPHGVLSFPIVAATGDGRMFVAMTAPQDLETIFLAADAAGRLVAEQLDRHLHVGVATDEAVARERLRVSRDLHDGLLQSFTGIVLQLETAHSILLSEPEEAKRIITQAEAALMADQRELRSYVDQLGPRASRPEVAFDFAARMDELESRLQQQWAIRLTADFSGVEPAVSRHLGHETYRIVHEAVMNSAKHGGSATNISVRMRSADGRIRIEVVDDGGGFDFQGRMTLEAVRATGAGPRMLAERIAALNGDLVVESTEAGARLDIVVPLGFTGGES